MQAMKTAREQLEILAAGVDKLYSADELAHKLAAGRPLRVKLGCDPTAPDLHLGQIGRAHV